MKDQDFVNTLSLPEPIGTEDDEVVDNNNGDAIQHDEIDSSKTLNEEIADLMSLGARDGPSEQDEVCIGTNLGVMIFTGFLPFFFLSPKRPLIQLRSTMTCFHIPYLILSYLMSHFFYLIFHLLSVISVKKGNSVISDYSG